MADWLRNRGRLSQTGIAAVFAAALSAAVLPAQSGNVSLRGPQSNVRDSGIGAFDLASRRYHSQYTDQTVQVTETAVLGTTVNETRLQYYRSASELIANELTPEIHVLGSFNSGGRKTTGRSTPRTTSSCRITRR